MNYDCRPTEQRALVPRLSCGMQPFSAPMAVERSRMAELGAGGLERFGKWRVVSGEVVRGRFHSLVAVTVTPSFPTIQSFPCIV